MKIRLDKNTKKILMYIREHSRISRTEIVNAFPLAKPTCFRLIDHLLKAELVIEEGYGESTGGRRPILLSFNKNAYYALGVDLGRLEIKVSIVNLDGEILKIVSSSRRDFHNIEEVYHFLENSIKQLISELQINDKRILGVGVGMPGPLKNKNGIVSTPTYFNGKSIKLVENIQKIIDTTVIVEKDANVATLSEKWFGYGNKKKTFVYVMASDGVGCGILINRNLYRGKDGEAGGLGHTTIDIFGEQCTCGNYGCLETIVSIPKIVQRVKKYFKFKGIDETEKKYFNLENVDAITIDMILNAYDKGSPMMQKEFYEIGSYLGVGVANMVSFINPEIVILGGRIGSLKMVRDAVKETLSSHVIGSKGKYVPVVISALDENVVRGASALVIDKNFSIF